MVQYMFSDGSGALSKAPRAGPLLFPRVGRPDNSPNPSSDQVLYIGAMQEAHPAPGSNDLIKSKGNTCLIS